MQSLDRRQRLTILGFVLIVLSLPFLILAVQQATTLLTGAEDEFPPQDIVFTNITGNSVTVTYKTTEPTTGVATAVSGGGASSSGRDSRDGTGTGEYRSHHITIPNLSPNTEYDITINSGGSQFPAGSISTGQLLESLGSPTPMFGRINSELNEGIVYAVAGNTEGNSTSVSSILTNNTFTLDKGSFRVDGERIPSSEEDQYDVVVFVDVPGEGQGVVQFAFSEEQSPDIDLDLTGRKFNPNIEIEVGNRDVDLGDDDDDEPIEDGVFLLDSFSESLLSDTYSSGAELSNPLAPYNIFISDVNPTGFTVNWLTGEKTTGYIEVLEEGVSSEVVDPRDGSIQNASQRYTHTATASSPSIPSGTVFEFLIVSNGIRFGSNIQETVSDYDAQFQEYIETYYSDQEEQLADLQQQEQVVPGELSDPTQTAEIPPFEYIPSPEIELEPFEVIVPAAPESAPLPIAFQGGIEPVVDPSKYSSDLASLGQYNPSLQLSNIDTSRDFLVAVRTTDGTWTTGDITETLGFSASLGSSLTQGKDAYVSAEDGAQVEVLAFGFAKQSFQGTQLLSEDSPSSIALQITPSVLSVSQSEVVGELVLYGYGPSGSSFELGVNETSELVQVSSENVWQSQTEALELGGNNLSVDNQLVSFVIDVQLLPVTGIGLDQVLIFLGIGMMIIGVIIYKYYNIKP